MHLSLAALEIVLEDIEGRLDDRVFEHPDCYICDGNQDISKERISFNEMITATRLKKWWRLMKLATMVTVLTHLGMRPLTAECSAFNIDFSL